MSPVRIALGVLAFTMLLHGCLGGSTIERTYYSVQYVLDDSDRAPVASPIPIHLRVHRFESSIAYDRPEIVYRSNPHEFRYYWYKLWAAKPEKLLRDQTVAHLRHSRLFKEVTQRMGDRAADYDLNCEVIAIEELDSADRTWYAHLDLQFTLVRLTDGQPVWQGHYQNKQQVFEKRPVFVVRALSQILRKQLQGVTHDLQGYFAEQGMAPPAPIGPNTAEEPTDANIPGATLREN